MKPPSRCCSLSVALGCLIREKVDITSYLNHATISIGKVLLPKKGRLCIGPILTMPILKSYGRHNSSLLRESFRSQRILSPIRIFISTPLQLFLTTLPMNTSQMLDPCSGPLLLVLLDLPSSKRDTTLGYSPCTRLHVSHPIHLRKKFSAYPLQFYIEVVASDFIILNQSFCPRKFLAQ